ncbi:MAG: hypothetical protein EU550_01805 [Promethearchaeota archaeon]|nr:MAG: hypothetical protein EU550_01805 [Candidatus Lokiarchaeota archaeon]
MGKSELFIKRVYELVNELKIPLIDERVYDKVKFKTKSAISDIKFVFEEDEEVIRGFLGLADYFHTIVIKEKDKFYIPHYNKLFVLENA